MEILLSALLFFTNPQQPAEESGKASWYSDKLHGRFTASGARYDTALLTAAHRTLPFGTRVQVIHQTTGRKVEVVINDRGPWIKGRIIDLSRAAATKLGMIAEGVAKVRLEILE
ncbi:MAG: septal ring lytic transglycosylase RlpA family protein [Bacteroidota bacterium]